MKIARVGAVRPNFLKISSILEIIKQGTINLVGCNISKIVEERKKILMLNSKLAHIPNFGMEKQDLGLLKLSTT